MAPIVVPQDVEKIVKDLVSEGVFPDDESAIREAVQKLATLQNQHALWSMLTEDESAAEDLPWNDETRRFILGEARRRRANGEAPSSDVLPD